MGQFKKGKLLVYLTILCGGLSFSGCTQIQFDGANSSDRPDYQVIKINPDHQTCEVAEDCVTTYVDCSGCECGIPINLNYKTHYQQRYNDLCADYAGPVCEMYCPPSTIICSSGSCTNMPTD